MVIESVNVKNYRSILDETINCEDLTVLVGANGSGKSSFLQALSLFYGGSPKLEVEDFYNCDTSCEIIITIKFKDLSPDANKLFSIYVQDGKLTVERVLKWEDGKIIANYHGATLQNSDFQTIRSGLELKDRGKTARAAYDAIRLQPDYNALPAWTKIGDVQEKLRKWEADNPDSCTRQRDDGQFFGFTEVAQGYLGRFTRFLLIPAVRDAAIDTAERRGSVLTDLMDLVVRSVLAERDAVKKLREDTQQKYQEIMDPTRLTELETLESQLTATLKTYVPDATVELSWRPLSEVNIPMPEADVKLVEDGFRSAVFRTGHGLQRAFILTMLQHLTMAQIKSSSTEESDEQASAKIKLPNLVIGIEEPELYQHPNRQRHFAKVLLQLASGATPGVAEKTQIIYSTHSPLFVDIDRINQLRLLKKIPHSAEKPKVTKVVSTNLDTVAGILWEVDGKIGIKYTGNTLLPRLRAIMTPVMSEGFFADVVVLVEGEDDRAAIVGTAKAFGYEFEGSGFSVIPCGGKTNIDRPFTIFKQLGIQTYVIWDSDYGKGETEGVCDKCGRQLDRSADPKENHRLLRLLGQKEIDWPERVENTFACFKSDLETTLREEIGAELFEECLSDCQSQYCIQKRKHALKNPFVIMEVIKKAQAKGSMSDTVKKIVEKILALKR